jgi:hypothetical protein
VSWPLLNDFPLSPSPLAFGGVAIAEDDNDNDGGNGGSGGGGGGAHEMVWLDQDVYYRPQFDYFVDQIFTASTSSSSSSSSSSLRRAAAAFVVEWRRSAACDAKLHTVDAVTVQLPKQDTPIRERRVVRVKPESQLLDEAEQLRARKQHKRERRKVAREEAAAAAAAASDAGRR